ncbi:GGDEF domain-containing protein [Noviherbaspirillum autotrophicum]|uniref:GGDEF domain-containing protein n=1 Tax=Noviherbaspirillum autotrophicum TaxID=709839 RepID=UPI0022B68EAD|nr:diguanylate cyclase [Noviherbaspirillum autotrophicum]
MSTVPGGVHFTFTASMGIAEFQYPEDVSKTISTADQALYRAKNTGRNRVELGWKSEGALYTSLRRKHDGFREHQRCTMN